MSLPTGSRIGSYEIVAPIGAGGMGEVYRARDTRLDRDVAIKILPAALAADAERLARFEREAKTLASLNHSNIAHVYGIEEMPGGRALVMELVDGEDLSRRISRGAIPLAEALTLTAQIANALEAAHEKGIIHRDLKPANIMLTADGEVKVLDFGLAKAGDGAPGGSSSELMNSPTITSPATQVGMILGTAAYMSPEQAKGRPADRRSDVWALGCVLFEMLTARRAFEGDDLSDTLAAVLRGDPDWRALPASTPPHVALVIQRCLARDRKERIPDASVVRYLLDAPAQTAGSVPAASATRRALPLALAAVAGAAIVAAAGWSLLPRDEAPRAPSRFRVEVESMRAFGMFESDVPLAISPDGGTIVFTELTGSSTNLATRAIDRLDIKRLEGTAGARTPFFSPDGKWIGYFTGTSGLRKVRVDGGEPVPVAPLTALPRGASWSDDGWIVFATTTLEEGIMRVPEAGGTPERLTRPNVASGVTGHAYPFALPNGRGVLFTTAQLGTNIEETGRIAVLDLRTNAQRELFDGTQPTYVESGHILYAYRGEIRAVPFDLDRLETTGESFSVESRVGVTRAGAGAFSISRNGTLVYIPSTVASAGDSRTLVWIDRSGREEPVGAPVRAYFALRLSHDGTRLALDVRDQETDIWVWDVARKALQRLTFDPSADIFPIWSHDGRTMLFLSGRQGPYAIYRQPSDGTGAAEKLTDGMQTNTPTSISSDGQKLIYTRIADTEDIMLFDVAKRAASPLVQTRFRERNGTLSPDGRWLAYESDQSSEHEIYVRPFPAVESGQWQVSQTGGRKPIWSRDGRELFYVAPDNALMSVPLAAGSSFSAGVPRRLFTTTPITNLTSGTFYDIMPDGRRFIMIKEAARSAVPAGDRPHFVVVLDWAANALK